MKNKNYFLMRSLLKAFEEAKPYRLVAEVAAEVPCRQQNITRLMREGTAADKTQTTAPETLRRIGKILGLTKDHTEYLVKLNELDRIDTRSGIESPFPLDIAYLWIHLTPESQAKVRQMMQDLAEKSPYSGDDRL